MSYCHGRSNAGSPLQEVEAAIWRGRKLDSATIAVSTSGWMSLDAELPGDGWPLRVLQCAPSRLTLHRGIVGGAIESASRSGPTRHSSQMSAMPAVAVIRGAGINACKRCRAALRRLEMEFRYGSVAAPTIEHSADIMRETASSGRSKNLMSGHSNGCSIPKLAPWAGRMQKH